MPTKTAKPKTTGKKGKGLTKKVGPFPMYVYLIGVGIVVLYLYYRHRNSSGQPTSSTSGQYIQPTPNQGTDVVPSGNATQPDTSAGSSGDSSVTFPTDYATETDLANAIDSVNNNTAAAIAGITFPNPNINITVPAGPNSHVSKTVAASKTAAKTHAAASAPTRYYTYKKNVVLRKGQTVHYTKGKGYYAA